MYINIHALRNRAKKCSLTTCGAIFLLLKSKFDSISRILIFSSWLYVVNKGQFSSAKTVIAYYSTFTIIMIFNSFLNRNKNFWSKKNLIGNPPTQIFGNAYKMNRIVPIHFQEYSLILQVLYCHTITLTLNISLTQVKTKQYLMYSKL